MNSKVEMKSCYYLFEEIGYFDIPINRAWISKIGEINQQNKMCALVNLGSSDLSRVINTVVNIAGPEKVRECLFDKKLFTKHSHEIKTIAYQLEYYCVLINKLEKNGVDSEILKYKLSLFNEMGEILYNLRLLSEVSYNYIKLVTNSKSVYQFETNLIKKE